MASDPRFGVPAPRVVYEVFDAEVVVLDLETGTYYSLRGSAAWIYRAAAAGATANAIADAFPRPASNGAEDSGEVPRSSVRDFLASLVAERLLESATSVTAPAEDIPAPPDSPFAPPQLEKFTDMQDLLLLDPIHDVDETGWPRAAAKANLPSR